MFRNYKFIMGILPFWGVLLSSPIIAEELTLNNFSTLERIEEVSVPSSNNVCGPEVRKQVAEALREISTAPEDERLTLEAELYDQYKYCAENGVPSSESASLAGNLKLGFLSSCSQKQNQFILNPFGSVFYEEMCNCGYDPQRRQFACPVTIKQRFGFGFGGAPLPGSREYVLHCVADSTGTLVPVGDDSVHLANEIFGNLPPWQFAVIANANQNLSTVYPMNGATRRARSILSWNFKPTSCNYRPIWGNVLNYRIRLDQ